MSIVGEERGDGGHSSGTINECDCALTVQEVVLDGGTTDLVSATHSEVIDGDQVEEGVNNLCGDLWVWWWRPSAEKTRRS